MDAPTPTPTLTPNPAPTSAASRNSPAISAATPDETPASTPASTAPSSPTARDLVAGPHHTALCVEDFDAALQFFTGFIGMQLEWVVDRRDGEAFSRVTDLPAAAARMAMLRLGAYRVELFEYMSPRSDRASQRQCDNGYTHMAFEVTDVEALHQRLMQAGYRTTTEPLSLRPGYSKLVYAYAPENAVIEFIQFFDESGSIPQARPGKTGGAAS
ncbi:hypothetical protein GSY71_04265 [Pusillimonas sp. TS35]|uniref:VOC family protein n=1 Tax=Paracandidimonas lactea TaxID=2895524 RepID=UPI00136F9009|nr:VOC family protein [Paracandidimonas lactea]MYN12364.1 hypothetical protein [Pusillimonas sp. TS35]